MHLKSLAEPVEAKIGWHDVEGWRSVLGSGGYQRWTVEAKDFGTGPFRWVVYQSPGGSLIAASEPFTLPQFPNKTVRVEAVYGNEGD